MKKYLLLAFMSLLIASFYFFFHTKNEQDANKIFNNYKLKTSGAGEAMDTWAFERSYPNNGLSSEKYLKIFQHEDQSGLASTREGEDCWESLGPENIGGRILCLAFHPTDPNIIYAGSASAGLWKTTTMGQGRYAWEHVPVGFPVLGIGAIVIDPDDPNIMYLGTGEVYHSLGVAEPGTISRMTRGTYGIGILKTVDGGVTWNHSLSFAESDLVGVSDMEMSKLNPNEVYAATTLGTYQTKNGGIDWNLIHPVGPAIDIEIDPIDDNVIYISQGNLNSNLNPALSGLFKSTDKGESFVELLDDGLLPAWSGNAKLSLLPNDPNTIYASIQVGWFNNGPTTPGGLFKSTDAGENWFLVNNTNVPYWQGWYSHDIAIHPTNTNEMMYVGIDAWKSVDGGNSINQVSDASTWQFGKISVDEPEGDDFFIHADIHAVYYHPLDSEKIFFAGDGGVHMSPDRGSSFITLNGGLQTTQFYPNFATSAQDSNFALGGTQDNGTYIYDGTPSWTREIGGDGMSAAINPLNDSLVYASAQGLFLAFSEDRAKTFRLISPPQAQNEASAFSAPYELPPSSPNIVYAGRQFLYKSLDNGNTWAPTSLNTVDGGNVIIDIAISPSNPLNVFVATSPNPFGDISSAKLLRSNNGGVTWKQVSQSLPNRIIKDIAIDPNNDQNVYIVYSGFGTAHMAISNDNGESWNLISTLPDVPTNSIIVDPLNSNHIYVGNDLGVYFSEDNGNTWEKFSHGLPEATLALNLSYSKANRKIRLASHGRGIFERNLVHEESTHTVDPKKIVSNVDVYPNPSTNVITLEFESGVKKKGQLDVVNIQGQKVLSKKIKTHSGKNTTSVEISNIQAGSYFIVLTVGQDIESIPFLKI